MLMVSSSHLIAQINQDAIIERLKGIAAGVRIYSENDTIPIVVYREDTMNNNTLWYLNGQVIDQQVLSTIDPSKIEEVKVDKRIVEFNEILYGGIIYVITSEDYSPKLISLNNLRAKYLNMPDSISTLFLLDGEVVNMDYDEFVVDENYILKIEAQVVDNSKEDLDIVVIKLITRSKENLEEANTIRIRGVEPYGMNKTSH